MSLDTALQRLWYGPRWASLPLWPLSWAFRALVALRRGLYRSGLRRAQRAPVPVVVVGNLTVGGTGKTPVVAWLARELALHGHRVGVVLRGYGGRATAQPQLVTAASDPREVGDEAVLHARYGPRVVVAGADRVAAARRAAEEGADVIVCDDGLQHPRLARDVEIAVLHFRGIGNGWLLPAGPLRDPPERLKSVDAVVLNGNVPPLRIHGQVFSMNAELDEVYSLADPSRRAPLAALVEEQQRKGTHIVAAAGIATPDRFFGMLRAAGLTIDEVPLPDHHDFAVSPFFGREYDVALVTEKDAVKCRASAAMKTDGRLCAVSLRTRIEPALVDLIEAKIKPKSKSDERATDGPSPA